MKKYIHARADSATEPVLSQEAFNSMKSALATLKKVKEAN